MSRERGIAELYAPKIGLVPVDFDFETAIPCHYGTFPEITPDASEFIEAMQGAKTKVWTGAIGESLEV